MSRLPVPGSDYNVWGTILNDFLNVSHNDDGTLRTGAIQSAGSVTKVNGQAPSGGSITLSASDVGALPVSTRLAGLADSSAAAGASNGQVLSYDSTSSEWVPATILCGSPGDATNSTPGLIQLSGDLGGVATSPSVKGINGITLPSSAPTGSGQVLTSTSSSASVWQTPASAPVSTVFGRTGAVAAAHGDYNAAQGGALPSTDDLSAIAAVNATSGNVSLNSHKLTNLANGTNTTDAAAFGQIPTSASGIGGLLASNNLSDVSNTATARNNLDAAQGLTPTAVKTSAYTASPGDFVPVDASGGSVTVTLPAAPPDKSRAEIKLVNTSSGNTVTINTSGSDVFNKTSGSTSGTLSLLNQALMVQYSSSSAIWYVQSDDLPLSQLDVRYASLDVNSRLTPTDRDNVSVVFTAAQTASSLTNGTTYRFNCSGGSISQTLPSAPAAGTTLSFKRTDTVAANTLSLVAGGSDTFGESSPTSIGGAQAVTYVYGTDGAWHATAGLMPIANLLTTSIANTLYSPLGVPAWQGNYQYVAGQLVVYSGGMYLGTQTFTSASSFNPNNWYYIGQLSSIPIDGTASDIQPNGNQSAGAIGKAADAGHIHPATSWMPADSGLKAWSFDPSFK